MSHRSAGSPRRIDADKSSKSKRSNMGRGDTALHIACAAGQLECVKLLCGAEHSDIINRESSSDAATPLLRCCEHGDVEVARALLERGALLHVKNVRDETALHVAFEKGHTELAAYLLSQGAKRCSAKCMKCQLCIKLLARRQERVVISEAQQHPAPKAAVEDVQLVLDEEFGCIDLQEELNKLKSEDELAMLLDSLGEGESGGDSASCAATATAAAPASGNGSNKVKKKKKKKKK